MSERIKISSREEYEAQVKAGAEPLLDSAFDLDIELRVAIQDELFGSQDNDGNRHNFFIWLWQRKVHVCEETGAFLGHTMHAEYMSHILTRGAHVEMWNDPRNINVLAREAHRKWETGKREKMRIWDKNKEVIATLKAEYSKLKPYNVFPKESNPPKLCPHCGYPI